MIETIELAKSYGPTVAVDSLSFTVKPGSVTGFLGPNGAGKSTTMRMILGLDRPHRGNSLLAGMPYRKLREPLRTVGALLDAGAAHPGRTAYHHLLWLAQSNRISRHRVDEVLQTVGLGSVAHKRVKTFSLGMRQRLGLAAALLGDPQILLLDEPVNGLDPEGIRWIRALLKDLAAQGRTVFISSHLMSEMALTADHLIIIGRGRLLADTGTAEFIEQHAKSIVRIRTPQPDRLHRILADHGIEAHIDPNGALEVSGTSTSQLGRLATEHGLTLDELSSHSASLEEAFMRLTEQAGDYSSTNRKAV